MQKLKPDKMDKKFKNPAECAFAEIARANGWSVTKRGYPDFICYKGDKIMFVEVKRRKRYRLKLSQHKFMNTLKGYGVPCYRWSPDSDWFSNKSAQQTATEP